MSKGAAVANIDNYKKELLKQWEELPPIFTTSSETGHGREELLNYIEELNNLPVMTSLDQTE